LLLITSTALPPIPFPKMNTAFKTPLNRGHARRGRRVVLSELTKAPSGLRLGVLKRMCAAAMPFGSEMAITVHDTRSVSSKVDHS